MSPLRLASYRAEGYIKNTLIILSPPFIKLYFMIGEWKGRKVSMYVRLTLEKMIKVVKK